MSYFVERLDASLEHKIPALKQFRNVRLPLEPFATGWFRDGPIDMNSMTPQSLNGHAEIRIKYGRPGREKYTISQDLKLFLPFDSTFGTYQNIQTFFDIEPQGMQRP